jgi:hypothetical protein
MNQAPGTATLAGNGIAHPKTAIACPPADAIACSRGNYKGNPLQRTGSQRFLFIVVQAQHFRDVPVAQAQH